MKPFYGDELVHQIISKSKLEKLTKNNKKYTINLNKDDYINLVNICVGLYSPLKGFCDYRDYCSIIEKNKINNNINWTIPILLNSSLKKKVFLDLNTNQK